MITDNDSVTRTAWHEGAAIATVTESPRRDVVSWLPAVLALAFGAFSIAVLARVDDSSVSHASTSTAAAVLDLSAGLGAILAGAIAGREPQRRLIGTLLMALGACWLSVDWIGWADGPGTARTLATVAAPFFVPLIVHLGAVLPNGQVRGSRAMLLVAIAYSVTAVVTLLRAVLRDPIYDRYCWNNCTANVFLVRAEPDLDRTLMWVWIGFSVIAGFGVTVVCARRLMRATPTARRSLVPTLGPVAAVAAAFATYGGVLAVNPAEYPGRQPFSTVFIVRASALVTLAVGTIWISTTERRTRRAVAHLADELGAAPPPGTLRTVLARSLGDDDLNVAYRLPGADTYVDAHGESVVPQPTHRQVVTPIVRNGEPVAVVIHDRSLRDSHDLAEQIGAASRLAVDNERLLAQTMSQLATLRASRARIVETADNTRRRLERDLHDGAQQQLLALSYELQLAEGEARSAGDTRLANTMAAAVDEAGAALLDLRELAHGIFPVILTEAGLGPAIATYVDRAPLRVDVVGLTDERFRDDAEIAAYSTVTAGIASAVQRSASRVTATITYTSTELHVDLVDDGTRIILADLIHVTDRVGALGGRLDSNGSQLTAVIPCG